MGFSPIKKWKTMPRSKPLFIADNEARQLPLFVTQTSLKEMLEGRTLADLAASSKPSPAAGALGEDRIGRDRQSASGIGQAENEASAGRRQTP